MTEYHAFIIYSRNYPEALQARCKHFESHCLECSLKTRRLQISSQESPALLCCGIAIIWGRTKGRSISSSVPRVTTLLHRSFVLQRGTQNKLNPTISSYCRYIRFGMKSRRRLALSLKRWWQQRRGSEYYVYVCTTPCTFPRAGDNCLINTLLWLSSLPPCQTLQPPERCTIMSEYLLDRVPPKSCTG